jgi:outer membrane lipoprotein SlyB
MNKTKLVFIATLSVFALTGCDGSNVLGNSDAPSSTDIEIKEVTACDDCGTIISITPVSVKGDSSGAGGAIGAVVGGLLGNQVGGGNGKKVATVVGVVGGALAGNEIEKSKNAVDYFDCVVGMEQGGQRTMRLASTQGLSIGTAVKISGNDLELR